MDTVRDVALIEVAILSAIHSYQTAFGNFDFRRAVRSNPDGSERSEVSAESRVRH
jgi:hypothetical protein